MTHLRLETQDYTVVPLGVFVTGPHMVVADPGCDSKHTFDVQPGAWVATALEGDTSWGRRSLALVVEVVGGDSAVHASDWRYANANVGVDTGQLGFYDADRFAAVRDAHDVDRDTTWYEAVCALTCDPETSRRRVGGTVTHGDRTPFGAVTGSGYGDGVYPVYVRRNEAGVVVALACVFCPDDEDEEDK